jgi:hypothetical protein
MLSAVYILQPQGCAATGARQVKFSKYAGMPCTWRGWKLTVRSPPLNVNPDIPGMYSAAGVGAANNTLQDCEAQRVSRWGLLKVHSVFTCYQPSPVSTQLLSHAAGLPRRRSARPALEPHCCSV